MTDNLIERLRGYGDGNNDLMDAAADRIEKLEEDLNCNLPDYDPKIGIVKRLRQLGNWRVDGTKSSPIYNKSADRIEKLEAALRGIAGQRYDNYENAIDNFNALQSMARQMLEEKDD